jgi:integrase
MEQDINLKEFYCLSHFLKKLSTNHKPKQALTFTEEEVNRFLINAPNEGVHLVHKLILLFGIYGGLRPSELTDLCWGDISENTSEGFISITIRHSKTDQSGA